MRRTALAVLLLGCAAGWAQDQASAPALRPLFWRPLGGHAIELGLAGPAGAPIVDVAFSSDGTQLVVLTSRGEVWTTSDLGETWTHSAEAFAALAQFRAAKTSGDIPPPAQDPQAVVYRHPYDSSYLFALGEDLYRSSDEGHTWIDLTGDAGGSLIGPGQRAIAFSPQNPNWIVVANTRGLWRSMDLGLSWSDLNRNLPNLPETRIWRISAATAPLLFFAGVGPAELSGSGPWRIAADARMESWLRVAAPLASDDRVRRSPVPLETPPGWTVSYRVWINGSPVSPDLTACRLTDCRDPAAHYISAFGSSAGGRGAYYVGTSDGHLWVSQDSGRTWEPAMQGFNASGSPVTAIYVSPLDSSVALAAVGGRGTGHIFRTTNSGRFWDDLSANLPDTPVHAVAANPETGSIYLASDSGVFYTRGDLRNPGAPTTWIRLAGNLPDRRMEDLKLDTADGSLYVAVAGYGLFRATVPDIADSIRVLNAADLTSRAAAPGGLLTVIGAPVLSARAGNLPAPVLASSQGNSQIQVPFESTGQGLNLGLETQSGTAQVGFPLEDVSPAIFVDADGSPLVLDAAGGILLDGSRPAHAGSQILVLATGLGRVQPDWPTGLAAPLDNPPATVAPVSAYLDGAPLKVLSSTLAAGYIGVYIVRVELPSIVNAGTAELTLGSGDKLSNEVRIFLDPNPQQ